MPINHARPDEDRLLPGPDDVPTSYQKLYVDGVQKAQPLWPSPDWT